MQKSVENFKILCYNIMGFTINRIYIYSYYFLCGDLHMNTASLYWEKALENLKENLTWVSYNTWISPLEPFDFTDGVFTLATDNTILQDTVKKRYCTVISSCLSSLIGQDVAVNIILAEQKAEFVPSKPADTRPRSNSIGLSTKYTFDNFVVGPSNKFAHAASLAVAETPAKSYNPLFLYGSSGLGKTHLLHAIGNYISQLNPQLKVMYVSSEFFTNDLINSIREGKNEEFRNRYRQIDVLLIDDIQFIGGKAATQEEFFYTFDYLHQADKQIIISSDRPPKQLTTLEDRLVSRFEWGLICDIQAPDYETRFAILKKKLQNLPLDVPSDVLDYIASNIDTNVRELEGALNRITAYSQLGNSTINMDLAKNVLGDETPRTYTVDKIKTYVCDFFDIPLEDLMSNKRTKEVVYARQLAMYICRNLLDLSTPQVGESFNRDHTTAIHAIKKINESIRLNNNVQNDYNDIINNIKNN